MRTLWVSLRQPRVVLLRKDYCTPMQPIEENTFNQVPWFATTLSGSIDLYASTASRYSNNLNGLNNSHTRKLSNKDCSANRITSEGH